MSLLHEVPVVLVLVMKSVFGLWHCLLNFTCVCPKEYILSILSCLCNAVWIFVWLTVLFLVAIVLHVHLKCFLFLIHLFVQLFPLFHMFPIFIVLRFSKKWFTKLQNIITPLWNRKYFFLHFTSLVFIETTWTLLTYGLWSTKICSFTSKYSTNRLY